jgi:hypothetical protein
MSGIYLELTGGPRVSWQGWINQGKAMDSGFKIAVRGSSDKIV